MDELQDLRRRLVEGYKADGRSLYDEQAKAELVALCMQPGASVSRLARECGVNANQVCRWLRERGHVRRPRPVTTSRAVTASTPFVAVPVVATQMPAEERVPSVVQMQARLAQRRGHRAGRHRHAARRPGDRDAREAAVFRLDEGLKVYLHRAPVDFRLSINGLGCPGAACAGARSASFGA